MAPLTPNPIFLLDENVDYRLFRFLKSQKIDVKLAPKTLRDKDIAQLSFKDQRILVTNDEDFQGYAEDEIYSVIWLRIPQNKPDPLIKSFEKILFECKNFAGRIIILNESGWKDFPLLQKL